MESVSAEADSIDCGEWHTVHTVLSSAAADDEGGGSADELRTDLMSQFGV
jgi:hypothetical protein